MESAALGFATFLCVLSCVEFCGSGGLRPVARFLYDHLKECGPTRFDDPDLLLVASDLPGHCQELIAQYGSLEAFLTRSAIVPPFSV